MRRAGRAVTCVIGTRPEAIKMAPVILRLGKVPGLAVRVVTTGQHREMLARALADFAIAADRDLDLMRAGQGLADTAARALAGLAGEFEASRPDLVLAQGDTTTVLAAALASYYARVPFGHVEAGLRTGRPYEPFPEEKNRVLASHLAEVHFAPTPAARANLLREGIDPATVRVTGNTGVDALRLIASRPTPLPVTPATPRFLLITAHRRENFGAPMEEICHAALDLVAADPGLSVVFPVHPNPNVRRVVAALLGGHPRISLIEPAGYPEFVALMQGAEAILTDSGGVQEEGPALGKAVFVLRDATERPEAVRSGRAVVVGPHREAIVSAVSNMRRPGSHPDMAISSPYGDGFAAERIAMILARRFSLDPGELRGGLAEDWVPPEEPL